MSEPKVSPAEEFNYAPDGLNHFTTVTGILVEDITQPNPSEVSIDDIAHALSLVNRFGGHINNPWSVAQHSLLVSALCPYEWQLVGLLHDAAEAYVGDMVAPLKHAKGMELYGLIERRWAEAIDNKLGLRGELSSYVSNSENHPVKVADRAAYNLERTMLKTYVFGMDFSYASPSEVRERFIYAYDKLKKR